MEDAVSVHMSDDSFPLHMDMRACAEGILDLTIPKSYGQETLLHMREEFIRHGYVKLHHFLTESSLRLIQSELGRLEKQAKKKDFEMPGYASPRKLSVLGGSAIKTMSPLLFRIYHHHAIRHCIEKISGRDVYYCQHPEEYMVANFLQKTGDTHGWHLDDPAYALVIFLETPKDGAGGMLEVIPNWDYLCKRKKLCPDKDITTLLSWAEENNLIERYTHNPGDAYLLRADKNLHRVSPIIENGQRRIVLNMAYQHSETTTYKNTANMLYGY